MGLGAPVNTDSEDKISFKANYDKELENETHKRYTQEIANVQAYLMEGKDRIFDAQFIGRLSGILSDTKRLFLKYNEDKAAEVVSLKEAELRQLKTPILDTRNTLAVLQYFRDQLALVLGVKHHFKDSVEHREPWDMQAKKKLELYDVFSEEQEEAWGRRSDEIWADYDALGSNIKKFCRLVTMDCTINNGDAHILLSGPKKSGKTNTAEPILRRMNRDFREYWRTPKWNFEYLAERPDFAAKLKDRYEIVDKFRIKKDMLVTPTAEELEHRADEKLQFQTIDVNEGMEVATNLQSMQREKVEAGVRMFTTRSLHSIIVWEYQVAKRPTELMLEGMNYWLQKMTKKFFVLSMSSHLVGKRDPYYMKELDDCRSDFEISKWISGRGSKSNPNFIGKFKAPRMSAKNEVIFASHYKNQRAKRKENDALEREVRQAKATRVKEMWEMVNDKNLMSVLSIRGLLTKSPDENGLGYNDRQADRFMKKYWEYDEEQRWRKYGKQMKVEVEE